MSFPHVDLSLDLLWFMLLDLVSGCLYLSVSLHRVFLAWINASFILFGIWTYLHMSFADLYFCCVQSFISLLWTQKQKESVKEFFEEHFILCTPEKKSHQQCPLSVWILWNPLWCFLWGNAESLLLLLWVCWQRSINNWKLGVRIASFLIVEGFQSVVVCTAFRSARHFRPDRRLLV